MEMLLAKEAVDLNSKSIFGETLLSLAAEKGHDELVELLLAKES